MQLNNLGEVLKSEGLLLALIPFVGTFIGFVFEAGYVSFYDVPISLIQIDFNRIVASTGLVFLIFMFWFKCLSATSLLYKNKYVIIRALYEPTLMTLFFGAFAYAAPGEPNKWAILAGGFVAFSLLNFLPPAFEKRRGTRYLERLSAHLEECETQSGRPNIDITSLFALIFFGSTLVFGIGRSVAVEKHSYWVPEQYPSMVVVEFYGDVVVLKEFDTNSREIKQRMLVTSTQEEGIVYNKVKIGPLIEKRNDG